MTEYISTIKPFVRHKIDAIILRIKNLLNQIRTKYFPHQKTYQKDCIRDFADALIYANEESMKNEKEFDSCLTDQNFSKVLSNLFTGEKINFLYNLNCELKNHDNYVGYIILILEFIL